MKEFNIKRIMDGSPFIESISDETYEALADYYNEVYEDITNINVDDNIVNGISEMTIKEFRDYGYDRDSVHILVEDNEKDLIAIFE